MKLSYHAVKELLHYLRVEGYTRRCFHQFLDQTLRTDELCACLVGLGAPAVLLFAESGVLAADGRTAELPGRLSILAFGVVKRIH